MPKGPTRTAPWPIYRPCSPTSSVNTNSRLSGSPMTVAEHDSAALNATLCMRGQGVVKGYAIGRAAVMGAAALEVVHYRIQPDDVQGECRRLTEALAAARDDLQNMV